MSRSSRCSSGQTECCTGCSPTLQTDKYIKNKRRTDHKTDWDKNSWTNSPNVTSVKRLLLQYKRDIIKWTLEKHCGEINNEERAKTPQRSDIITQSSTDWSVGVQSTLTSDLISNQRLLCLLRTQGVIILSTSRTWGSAPVTAGNTFNTAAPPTSDICPGFKSVLRHGPSGQNSCSTVHYRPRLTQLVNLKLQSN